MPSLAPCSPDPSLHTLEMVSAPQWLLGHLVHAMAMLQDGVEVPYHSQCLGEASYRLSPGSGCGFAWDHVPCFSKTQRCAVWYRDQTWPWAWELERGTVPVPAPVLTWGGGWRADRSWRAGLRKGLAGVLGAGL